MDQIIDSIGIIADDLVNIEFDRELLAAVGWKPDFEKIEKELEDVKYRLICLIEKAKKDEEIAAKNYQEEQKQAYSCWLSSQL